MDKFGIELEMKNISFFKKLLEDHIKKAFSDMNMFVFPEENPSLWTLKSEHCGIELTSPAMNTTKESFSLIKKVLVEISEIVKKRKVIDHECGYHVHFDMKNYNEHDIKKILRNFQNYEKTLLNLQPPSRTHNLQLHEVNRFKIDQELGLKRKTWYNHYSAVNLSSMGEWGTLEIRYAAGTINHEKVNNWIHILLSIIDDAVSKEFQPKTTKNINDLIKIIYNSKRDFIEKNDLKNWTLEKYNIFYNMNQENFI